MNAEDWEQIKHFHAGEAWGDWQRMDRDAVVLIDYVRGIVGYPFIIHCGYSKGTGHTKQSFHYRGQAEDGHFVGIAFKKTVDVVTAILARHTVGMVRRAYELPDFMDGVDDDTPLGDIAGLGIYPHWTTPGFHFDNRGYKARWGAVQRGGAQVYVSFDEAYRRIRQGVDQ